MKTPTQLSSHRTAHRPEVRYLWRRRGLLPPRVGFDPDTTPNQTLYPQRPQKRSLTPHTWSKLKKKGRKTFLETSARILRRFKFELKRRELARLHRAVARFLGYWWRADIVFFANGETGSSKAEGANEPAQWKRAGHS